MSDSTTSPQPHFLLHYPQMRPHHFCGNMGVMYTAMSGYETEDAQAYWACGRAYESAFATLTKRFQEPHSQLICQHLLGMVSWIAAIPLQLTWQKIKVRPSIIGIVVEHMPGIMLCPMRFH